jgi:simple sugar transport system ATP-binding protein
MATTDRVTVLRDGRVVATHRTGDTTAEELAAEMLGRRLSLVDDRAAVGVSADELADLDVGRTASSVGREPVLELDGVTVTAADGHRLLDSLSLALRPGEIVGLAGVEGNGQQALVDLLSNVLTLDAGEVRVLGRRVAIGRRGALRDLAVIPADRQRSGVVLQMTVAENLVLNQLGSVSRHGVLRRQRIAVRARGLVEEYRISTAGVDAPVWTLSGGNQQRVVLARELSRGTPVLVVAQPTQGLDVGAMESVWTRLREAADRGVAVLVISSDVDEILELSDRVAVIFGGRILGEMERSAVDTDRLGLLMGGVAS